MQESNKIKADVINEIFKVISMLDEAIKPQVLDMIFEMMAKNAL